VKGDPVPAFRRHRVWWQLLVFVLVSSAAVYIGMAFDKKVASFMPESGSLPSTLNQKPSGYSGLAELTDKLHLPWQRWQKSYRELKKVSGTLVVISPDESFRDFEVEQILHWVSEGNCLIYLDNFAFKFERRLIKKIGLDAYLSENLMDSLMSTDSANPEMDNVPNLAISADYRLSGGTALLKDKFGSLLVKVPHKKGTVIVGSTPSLGANRRLSQKSNWPNFQFLINLFRTTGGTVWFDEASHGFSTGSNVFIVLGRGPVGAITVQLLAVVLLGFAASWQRFGSVEVINDRRKISNTEFIRGLAAAYQRVRATDLALDVVFHSFKGQLCKALGISTAESNQKIGEAWSLATSQPASDLIGLLDKIDAALSGEKPSTEQMMELVTACDKITERSKELLFAKGWHS
jgi:hypothetical protein